jgi:hypothetical protein
MMRSLSTAQRTMDLVVSRRIFNTCWISASLGISIVQMRLLAQTWQISSHALVPACLVSTWTFGSLIGMRVPSAPRTCGSSYLACTLLWLASPSLVSWHLPLGMVPPALVSIVVLALVALVLGASSTSWLAQQRPWPSATERTVLMRSLVGLTIGLVVAWMLPAFAGLIALTCCLPLFALDFFLSSRAPLPIQGGVAASWVGRYWNTDRWQLQLDRRRLPRYWWWNALGERPQASRWYLPLPLLASGVAVMLGSVWGAVPTLFAAGLAATHTLDKLAWLLGGQLVILVLGTGFLFAARNVIGFPDRLLPLSRQSRVRSLALAMPVGMEAGLVALGLPFLQTPWWLALSLASYTLAGAVWGMLLPRLRPGLGVVVSAQRHLLLGRRIGLPDSMQLASGRACEVRARLLLTTFEGVLIAVITPLSGWMIDWLGSVDDVLVMVGLVFVLGLGCFALGHALFYVCAHRLAHTRAALTWQRLRLTGSSFPKVNVAADR